MDTTNFPEKEPLLNYETCLQEVPTSLPKVSEVDDYIVHFCGLQCYDKWHKQAEKNTKIS